MNSACLLLVVAFFLSCFTAFSQTITLEETRPYPSQRIGLNVASGGRQGSVLRNLIAENPGMQPTQTAAIVTVNASRADSHSEFTDSNPWTNIPVNFYAGGTFQVLCQGNATDARHNQTCTGGNGPSSWSDTPGTSGSRGCSGTIRSNTAANSSTGVGATFTISPSCPALFSKDTEILIRAKVQPTPEAAVRCGDSCWGWDTSTSGEGAVETDHNPADFPSGSQGVQTVLLDTSRSPLSTATVEALSSDQGTDIYYAGSYTQSIQVKVLSGSNLSMTFSGSRTGRGARWTATRAIPNRPGWQSILATFTVRDPEGPARIGDGVMRIAFTLAGQGKIAIFAPSLVSERDQKQKSVYTSSAQSEIQEMATGECRYWGGAPNNATTLDNWTTPTANRMPTEVNVANTRATGSASLVLGLNEFLRAAEDSGCKAVQVVAPITMPWSNADGSDNDVQHLIEYLNGPSTARLGEKRIRDGGPAEVGGWSAIFDHIDISYGNEVWNAAAGDEAMPMYTCPGNASCWAYQLLVSQWCGAAHRSPYWKANDWCDATVQPNANGFWVRQIHSLDRWGKVDSVSVNAYTMQQKITDCRVPAFWLSAQTEAIWGNSHQENGDTYFYQTVKAAKSAGYHVVVYEYQNSTLNNMNCTQAQLDGFANGLGYGIIDAVQALEGQQRLGITDWDFFTIYQRTTGVSSTGGATHNYIWGAFSGASPGAWDNPRPSYYAIAMANNCGGSGARQAFPVQWTRDPTYNFASLNGVTAATNVPYLYAYEFASGNQRCLLIANLDPSRQHIVSIKGANPPSGMITQILLSSQNIIDNNDAANSKPAVIPVTSLISRTSQFTIPAHSMVTETWTVPLP